MARDDQWIAEIRQPSAVLVRTTSSAPAELTALPRDSPVVLLVDDAHAASPRTVTRTGLRVVFIDLA